MVEGFKKITSDSKFILSIALFSLTILFYEIKTISYVVVNFSDFLGLTSHLTIIYWIGFFLIFFCSILAFLNAKITQVNYIIILFVVGLFLFGIGIFSQENAEAWSSYYPTGEAKNIQETGYIDISTQYPLISYYSWPAFHFITISLMYLTGIKLVLFLEYMPLFWLTFLIFISFGLGKRFNLPLNQAFLLSFLSLSSYWFIYYYYSPQSFAYMLYLSIFLIILFFSNKFAEKLLLIILFSSMVITHVLTPIFTLLSMFGLSFLQKNKKIYKILFPIVIIFISWYIYIAEYAFIETIKQIVDQATKEEFFTFAKNIDYIESTILIKKIIGTIHLYYFLLAAVLIIMVIIYLKFKTNTISINDQLQIKICIFWMIAGIPITALKYGTEMDSRFYAIYIVPILCAVIKSFGKKRSFMVLLMILYFLPHIPAHYGTESILSTYSTDLSGSNFFSTVVNPEYYIYPGGGNKYIAYYNQSNIKVPYESIELINSTIAYEKIDRVQFIIDSKHSSNYVIYNVGSDYIKTWLQINEESVLKIYDNGNFKLYENKNIKKYKMRMQR